MNTIKKHVPTYLLPLFIVTCIILLIPRQTKSVFPDNNDSFMYNTYSDIDNRGNSIINKPQVTDQELAFLYTLQYAKDSIYVGLSFKSKTDMFIDISQFQKISIAISSPNARTIHLILLAEIPGLTNPADNNTYCPLEYEIPLWQQKNTYTLRIKDYTIPDWWLLAHGLSRYDIKNINFTKIFAINIEQSSGAMVNIPDIITIKSLTLEQSKVFLYIGVAIILALYYILLIIKNFIPVKTRTISEKIRVQDEDEAKANDTIIEYTNLTLSKTENKDLQKIIDFLGKHYQDPSLTVTQTSDQTGVHQSKIPRLIKEHYNMSFPRFVNTIRITEAKRLLVETDYTIIDIAMSVGYNNVPHFNRTFKSLEKMSPKEYRESHQ